MCLDMAEVFKPNTMTKPQLPSNSDAPHWLTLREASQFLGIHYTTLRNWADKGEIPVFRTPGGHRRFRLADVRGFLEARASQTSLANVDGVYESALGRVRQEMEKMPLNQTDRRHELDENTRQTNRERGRRLFALALNYVMRPQQRPSLLEDGRELGRQYGRQVAHSKVTLAEAGRTVQFFRRQLLEAVRRDETLDAQDVQIRQTLAQFLDEVLYAMLEGYETASEEEDI